MNDLAGFKAKLECELYGATPEGHCAQCKQPFSDKNVHTQLGWQETNISKLCEDCFDRLCDEVEDF